MSQITKIKDSFGNGLSSVGNGISTAIEGGNKIVDRTDGAEKVAKLFVSVIDMMQLTLSGAFLLPFGILRGRLQAFVDIISALNIFNRGKDWFSPDDGLKGTREEGKRMWQSDRLISQQFKIFNHSFTIRFKIWNRTFMTVANIIDTARFLDRTEIIRLGKIGSFAVGRLPLLGLAKDVCVLGFSICSIAENGKKLQGSAKEFDAAKAKHAMWTEIANSFNPAARKKWFFKTSCSQNPCTGLSAAEKYAHRIHQAQGNLGANNAKIAKWTVYKEQLARGDLAGFCEAKRSSFEAKLDAQRNRSAQALVRTQSELNALKNAQKQDKRLINEKAKELKILNASRDGLVKDLAALQGMTPRQLADYKELRSVAKEGNVSFKRNKSWLTIVTDIGKIGLVILGTTGLAFGVSTALPFSVTILSLAFIVNAMGLYKFFYDGKQEMKMPSPSAAAAA